MWNHVKSRLSPTCIVNDSYKGGEWVIWTPFLPNLSPLWGVNGALIPAACGMSGYSKPMALSTTIVEFWMWNPYWMGSNMNLFEAFYAKLRPWNRVQMEIQEKTIFFPSTGWQPAHRWGGKNWILMFASLPWWINVESTLWIHSGSQAWQWTISRINRCVSPQGHFRHLHLWLLCLITRRHRDFIHLHVWFNIICLLYSSIYVSIYLSIYIYIYTHTQRFPKMGSPSNHPF